MARGSTAPLRRGAEATWQDACGPRRRRTGRTKWQGGHAPRRRPRGAPRVAEQRGHIRIVNRGTLSPIYAQPFPSFNPCGTMFPRNFLFCRTRGGLAGVGSDQSGGDRVDPSPRDRQIKHVLKNR